VPAAPEVAAVAAVAEQDAPPPAEAAVVRRAQRVEAAAERRAQRVEAAERRVLPEVAAEQCAPKAAVVAEQDVPQQAVEAVCVWRPAAVAFQSWARAVLWRKAAARAVRFASPEPAFEAAASSMPQAAEAPRLAAWRPALAFECPASG
jgi:hypothetical protein